MSIMTILLTSCVQVGEISDIDAAENMEEQAKIVAQSSDSILIPSFYELTQLSDVVIIGKAVAEVGIINTARTHTDRTKPDPNFFSIVQVYEIEVEQYLKGDGPKTIYVGQNQGYLPHGKTPRPEEIEQTAIYVKGDTFITLRLNSPYLMFLVAVEEIYEDYKIDGLQSSNFFVRPANPWRFDLTDRNHVIVEDEITDLDNLFPPQPLSEIIKLMNEPLPTPYPAPKLLAPTPYP